MLDVNKAKAKLEEEGLDALVALSLGNVYYATGYHSHFAELVKEHIRPVVITKDLEPFVVAPDFEVEDFKAHSQIKNFVAFPTEVYVKFNPGDGDHYAEALKTAKKIDLSSLEGIDLHTALVRQPLLFLAQALRERGLNRGTIGMDSEVLLPAATWSEIKKALPYATIVNADEIWTDLRMVKSEEELGYIREATKISQRAVESIIPMVKSGTIHSEIVGELRKAMTSEYSGPFEMSVDVSGAPATAITENALEKGQVLICDIGATYKWYCSDVSRMIAIGDPSKEFVKVYDATVETEETMISMIKPGASAREIYDTGMEIMRRVDPNYRRGHLGHGVGVELHEKPYIASGAMDFILEEGMAMTIEIPYYWWSHFSANMEDTLIVTKDGCEYAAGYCLSRELIVNR